MDDSYQNQKIVISITENLENTRVVARGKLFNV